MEYPIIAHQSTQTNIKTTNLKRAYCVHCWLKLHNYKRKHHFSGYLFQNRYKSILIEKDEYLMECGRYIERNPVRAGIVNTPGEYYWSSYNFYAKDEADDIITLDPLYIALSAIDTERRTKYIEYVAKDRPYERLLDEKLSELR